ncbi:unnamed protein product [Rhizophagus irregularis]|nr:unnamed protein product [Rhizophagus irregularis]
MWDYENDQWGSNNEPEVALKRLHNSQDITADFLKEIESNILVCESTHCWAVRCFEYSDSLRMDFTKLDINSKDKRN